MKKFNYTYKTTNLLTQEYYLGKHSTDNLEDGYLGSGNRLRSCFKKYGKENFKLEILEFFNSIEELNEAEFKLITEDIIKEKLCLNLAPGGQGGNVHPWSLESRKKISEKLKGRNNTWGDKVSKSLKGKLQPQERIERAANSRRGSRNGSWVDMDLELIKKLFVEEKLKIRQISRLTGIGRRALTNRLKSLGLF